MYEVLSKIIPSDRVFTNEIMAKHTSFKIGGPADVYVQPSSCDEVKQIIHVCRKNDIEYVILGQASNVLVPDEGLSGAVVQFHPHFSKCQVIGNESLVAESGASLAALANLALQNELTGLEFASGIPGSVGGAICMNAGAYGHEIADVCSKVNILMPDGEIITVLGKDMGFGYRTSILQHNKGIVLSAEFTLSRGDRSGIGSYMKELNSRRRKSQPLEYPSVGSTFKRPPGHFAGKLISDCGLKGFAIGGAMVSEKHAGFIINTGGATARDVQELMKHIRSTVLKEYGVELEPEVKILCNS